MSKKGFGLILLLCMLVFSGCSLAKEPQKEKEQDRLMGVYLVNTENGQDLTENENWVEYGTQNLDTEYGKLDIPRMILPAVYDSENGDFTFPGVQGYALFSAVVAEEEGNCDVSASDLADGMFGVQVNDLGTSYDLSGTLYVGKDDFTWIVYHVYQTADGMVYLDGTGNSYNGSNFSTTLEETQKVTGDGKEGTLYTKVEVKVEEIPALQTLLVHQYNAAGERIATNTLSLTVQPEEVVWAPNAAWAVVEEQSADGVKRTAYDRTQGAQEQITHTAYILNSESIGEGKIITFAEAEK